MNVKEANKALISVDDISKVFRVLAKNWFYFFVFPIIGGFFAYFYTYRLPDVYSAKAQIMLEDNFYADGQSSVFGVVTSGLEEIKEAVAGLDGDQKLTVTAVAKA